MSHTSECPARAGRNRCICGENPSEADYAHGSEVVGVTFRDYLIRQFVDFRFESGRLYMNLGPFQITFSPTPQDLAPELKKALESPGVRLIAQVESVSRSK